jgi:hypothetical protein
MKGISPHNPEELPHIQDLFITEVQQMNLPYLEYVDGIFPTDPVDLETLNLEM